MRVVAAVACILVSGLLVLPLAAMAAPTTGVSTLTDPVHKVSDRSHWETTQYGSVQVTPEPEARVTLDVHVRRTGDARWIVSIYRPLDGENETRAFEELGDEFVAGTADVSFDADLFRQYARAASDASGRTLTIPAESVERRAEIIDDVGVLTLEFTWTNFASEDGNRLIVDDSFRTESGTWLPRLQAGQVLVIHPPEGYVIYSAPKGYQNATFRWEGPQELEAENFRIVYRADDNHVTRTTVRTSEGGPTTPGDGDFDTLQALAAFAAVLLGGGLAAYLAVRRRTDARVPGPTSASRNGDEPADGVTAAATDNGDGPPDVTPTDGNGDVDPSPEDPFAGVNVELLSDEERVLRLLEANGGRMKQARIVRETDWSNAKVSQLLSSMDDEDQIDKLRIGRENLISLPDVDVEDVEK